MLQEATKKYEYVEIVTGKEREKRDVNLLPLPFVQSMRVCLCSLSFLADCELLDSSVQQSEIEHQDRFTQASP